MVNIEKLIAKLKRTKYGHKFEDLEKILLAKGFELSTNKGSHFIYKNPKTKTRVTLAKHKPMSPKAVQDVITVWDEE